MTGVAIMGCGTVGSGAMKMLTDNAREISRAAGREVALTHVLDVRPVEVPQGVAKVSSLDEALSSADTRVFVESIGGVGIAYELTRRALSAGRHVVTSNKELVAEHGDELCALAAENSVTYRYEASVGGGVPIIRPLNTCLAGNLIQRIDGIVNGSTNYLLTRMEKAGFSFPAALGEARQLGYVEGNPDADLEGWDARRKLAILANTAFGAKFSDHGLIPTTGIKSITEADFERAHALGGTIKLIAHARRVERGWTGWVSPAFVPESHMLHTVDEVFNGILVNGDFIGDVMFYGRGAGSMPTASAIVGDIIETARAIDRPVPFSRFERVPEFVPDTTPRYAWAGTFIRALA
jgi:homoserine dehydrogenase